MTWQTDLYDGMVADIVELTKRPDLEAEAKIAMRAATTNTHLTDAYWRDCATVQVQLPNSSNQLALDVSTLFPGCRGFQTIRPIDQNFNLIAPGWLDGEGRETIEIVEMGDIYDPQYGNLRNNIAYTSGSSLVIRSPITCWGYAISYLKAPQVRRDLYDSWIAQMAPDVIIFWAAAILFNTNGNEEKAKSYLSQVEKLYIPQLKSNFLLSAMR